MRQNAFGDWYYTPGEDASADPELAARDLSDHEIFFEVEQDEDDSWIASCREVESGEDIFFFEGFSSESEIVDAIAAHFPSSDVDVL